MSATQVPSPRKRAAILAAGWIGFYLFYLFLARNSAGYSATHMKIAIFCSFIIAWIGFAMHLAPRVQAKSMPWRFATLFSIIIAAAVLPKLLRAALADDPVWATMLSQAGLIVILPACMHWITPAVVHFERTAADANR